MEILEQVQVDANSANVAADTIYNSFYSFYFNEPHAPLPALASVRNLTLESLNASDFRIYV